MTERTREGLALLAIALMCLLVSLAAGTNSEAGSTSAGLADVLRVGALLFGLGGLGVLAWDLLHRRD